MIKILALSAAIAAVPVVMAPPATAYDPCERATQQFERAVATRDAARTCRGYVCTTPLWAAEAVAAARSRMHRACR